jgi:DNA-binding winged helix-turn-helix (wHTH) protein
MLHQDVSERSTSHTPSVRFDSFEVSFELRELRKNGVRVPLQHKPFRILELLLKQPGALVTRTQLAKDLWPHLPFSFERSLNTAVNALRQVLDDSPRESRYIETRSGLGYRFIGELEQPDEPLIRHATAYIHSEGGDANQDCLKGRYFLNKVTGESLQRAIGYFQSALEQDSGCAPAWAGLAEAYSRLALTGTVAASDVCHKARESAREAVHADASLAAAHASLGFARMVFDGDWAGAETDLARAIALDEGHADAHRARALLLSALGKHDEARETARHAQDLEPLSLPIGLELARILYVSRDDGGAIKECWNLLSLEPRFWPAQRILALASSQLGLHEEAITEAENACVCSDRHPAAVCALGCVSASMGLSEQTDAALRELTPESAGTYTSFYWSAVILARRGEPAASLDALAVACTQRDPLLLWLGVDPGLDPLRAHSGFSAMLQRLGLRGGLRGTRAAAG